MSHFYHQAFFLLVLLLLANPLYAQNEPTVPMNYTLVGIDTVEVEVVVKIFSDVKHYGEVLEPRLKRELERRLKNELDSSSIVIAPNTKNATLRYTLEAAEEKNASGSIGWNITSGLELYQAAMVSNGYVLKIPTWSYGFLNVFQPTWNDDSWDYKVRTDMGWMVGDVFLRTHSAYNSQK